MTHLGIVGHSAEGAALCFRTFCLASGVDDHPDVTMDCISMARAIPSWEAGDHAAVREILATSIDRVARAGAGFFVCPDNTAHLALEIQGPPLPLPGLHIAAVVAAEAARRGYTRVGILGTRFTMDGPVYPRMLAAQGIAAVPPDFDDRRYVDAVIFDELVNGIVSEESRDGYIDVIERLVAAGCDAVALVCTEIPLLVTDDVSPLPTLDSTRLLARAAYEVAAGRVPLPTWRGGPFTDEA